MLERSEAELHDGTCDDSDLLTEALTGHHDELAETELVFAERVDDETGAREVRAEEEKILATQRSSLLFPMSLRSMNF